MPATATATRAGPSQRHVAGALLLLAAVGQLVGQAVLRWDTGPLTDPRASGTWVPGHVLLALAALCLLAAAITLARIIGPGPGTWLGLGVFVVGQSLAVAVLAVDLLEVSIGVDAARALDTWDFLSVVGLVVLLLELRRRRRDVELSTSVALVALAVPPVDGLVLVAAAGVVVGFAGLAHGLVTPPYDVPRARLTAAALVAAVAYVVAGAASWPRAALAVVVVTWTVHDLLRTRSARSTTARRVRPLPPGPYGRIDG